MDIKGIAKLAGVSPATISKIVTGKDESISEQTRARVLEIVKKYNYVPYAKVQKQIARTLRIGILLQNDDEALFATCISEFASLQGYSTIVLYSKGSTQTEQRCLHVFAMQNVECVIWQPASLNSLENATVLLEKQLPFYLLCADDYAKKMEYNANSTQALINFQINYKALGFAAAETLVNAGHKRIVCRLPQNNAQALDFHKGYISCLHQHGLAFIVEPPEWTSTLVNASRIRAKEVTAAICFTPNDALFVWGQLMAMNRHVPSQFSLLCVGEAAQAKTMPIPFTMLDLPMQSFAVFLAKYIIGKTEKKSGIKQKFITKIALVKGETVAVAQGEQPCQITVVGSINLDTTLTVQDFPQTGFTVLANKFAHSPGGKGANQAIAAAKLGAQANLIGRVGTDSCSFDLYEELNHHGVNTQGVLATTNADTGQAYIHVKENGESSILVYVGANSKLTPKDLNNSEFLFEGSSYCLLQTEIPIDTVLCAAKIAAKKGCEVILKPASIKYVDENLLQNVSYFVPNRKEAQSLCPKTKNVKKQAQFFRSMGAKHVIITLDKEGCFLLDDENELYFSALDVKSIDTTGAADVFCAALAVSLGKGESIIKAVQYATYVAGISTTEQGSQTNLPDAATLHASRTEIDKKILYGNKA